MQSIWDGWDGWFGFVFRQRLAVEGSFTQLHAGHEVRFEVSEGDRVKWSFTRSDGGEVLGEMS